VPKLRVLSGKEVCKIMARHGFEQVRVKGSHMIMQKHERNTTVTVPVSDHGELKTGTLLGIIRQSGLPRSLFEIE
jgi:predicted RNA binding protein YcfA (HicA-like mRNA interferase family)